MNIFVNNKKRAIKNDTTVCSLLEEMQLSDKKGIAVALNQKVVPRNKWNQINLEENDNILLIKASQGG
jgi:sulfur carrier protein